MLHNQSSDRILAFLLTSSTDSAPAYRRAYNHLQQLATTFDAQISTHTQGKMRVAFCYIGDLENLCLSSEQEFSFFVDRPAFQSNGEFTRTAMHQKAGEITDRFLHITLHGGDRLELTTDYAATVPCFYSLRNGCSFSNIEPLVVLDSGSSLEDIDPANMYLLLRYAHLIWTRTLFRHIFMLEPDSRAVWDTTAAGQINSQNLQTVKSSTERETWSDRQVADGLYELNQQLVTDALAHCSQILLPLSSGYDSRMILAACGQDKSLAQRVETYTYGPSGSIEVKAARQLAETYEIPWRHVELPCHFLSRPFLEQAGAIFGSSLHFHGMYQLEFADVLPTNLARAVWTSGFMTGVPAGQHIGLMNIQSESDSLAQAMNQFSQSQNWTDDDLNRLSSRFDKKMTHSAEAEFRLAFDRFEGRIQHKSVLFDVWTRQRNFISYHPRVLEWTAPFVSPHMSPRYINFFLSLSDRHLANRLAVELMFKHRYSEVARIPSNSNGIQALTGYYNQQRFLARALRKLGVSLPILDRFQDEPINFDTVAIRQSGKEGIWPIFDLSTEGKEFLAGFFPGSVLSDLLNSAMDGSEQAYNRLVSIQAIAYAIRLIAPARVVSQVE